MCNKEIQGITKHLFTCRTPIGKCDVIDEIHLQLIKDENERYFLLDKTSETIFLDVDSESKGKELICHLKKLAGLVPQV